MAVLHKTRNEVLPSTQLQNFPMRAYVFPECKMAASTVYKHRVLHVAILHPGNTYALIGKFCNYVLGRTSFRDWIYGDWSPYIQSPCFSQRKLREPLRTADTLRCARNHSHLRSAVGVVCVTFACQIWTHCWPRRIGQFDTTPFPITSFPPYRKGSFRYCHYCLLLSSNFIIKKNEKVLLIHMSLLSSVLS